MNLFFFIWRLAVMILMRGKDIAWAIGRVGLKVEPVLGPEIARATANAISSPLHKKNVACLRRLERWWWWYRGRSLTGGGER